MDRERKTIDFKDICAIRIAIEIDARLLAETLIIH